MLVFVKVVEVEMMVISAMIIFVIEMAGLARKGSILADTPQKLSTNSLF